MIEIYDTSPNEYYPFNVIRKLTEQVMKGAKRAEVDDGKFEIKVYQAGPIIRIDIKENRS